MDLGEFADWEIFSDLRQQSDVYPIGDEVDEWDVIDSHASGTLGTTVSEASIRTRSGGLAVPAAHRQVPQSLQNSLKRGGKPVPAVKRPKPSTFDPQPRTSLQPEIQTDRLQISATSSMKVARPPQGPKSSRPAVQSKSNALPLDLQKRWIFFAQMIGNLSSFWQMYSTSESFGVHCITLIEKFEASTISKYIGTLQSVSNLLTDFKLSWDVIGTYKIADLLQMSREGRSTDLGFGASSVVRALRWAQRLLDISHWINLYSPLVSAFTVRVSGDRTEAVPLSLFVVLTWEKRLLSRDCPLHELVVIGGLLLILWGGLRFSDGQRVPLQSLSWSITALRGTCSKTKTTKSGQPWAVQSCGFLSFGSFGWVAKWLMALDGLWSTHSNPGDPQDFLLPMTCGSKFIKPLIPMSYSQTLKWLRYFCTIPWRHSQCLPISAPHNYTVHSLKSTTLSWAAQLAQQGHVTEEQRHLQGHPRRGSMRLYSRDDTAGQWALQATLIAQVRKGYRFVTPLHRGSQTPLIEEPAVTL